MIDTVKKISVIMMNVKTTLTITENMNGYETRSYDSDL